MLDTRIILSGVWAALMLTYLLGDPWTTGPRLVSGPALRSEAERRRAEEDGDAGDCRHRDTVAMDRRWSAEDREPAFE